MWAQRLSGQGRPGTSGTARRAVLSDAPYERRIERLELKYLVGESRAAAVRRDLAAICERDPHEPDGGSGYEVASLYLDTPTLAFLRAKERGDPYRFKLRVRTYPGADRAVLELKTRACDMIDKRRVAIDARAVQACAEGRGHPLREGAEARHFLELFSWLVLRDGAEPTLAVRYRREAWTSHVDDYARVTFDRDIAASRTRDWSLEGEPGGWCPFDEHWRPRTAEPPVVLELKCHARVPWWLTELIQRHDLRRESFSKYSVGMHVTGLHTGIRHLAPRSARALGRVRA